MVGNVEEINECIACGGTNLEPLLDLGEQPLANSFVKEIDKNEPKYPLATNYCRDCFHVQLTHKVNPDLLFKNYLYVSGTAKTQLDYFDWFANYVIERSGKVHNVLDIGCNDGSQLDAFARFHIDTYGIDPAENLYEVSSQKHKVVCDYFTGDQFDPDMFSMVICQNAFAHNYNQLELLSSMAKVLEDDGRIYITTSQADMILNGEFDTIYHEHLSFYNIKSMDKLARRAGLQIEEVITHPIHGNSYIFTLVKNLHGRGRVSYLELLMEQERDLYDIETYEKFRYDAGRNLGMFRGVVNDLKVNGYTVVGYGAPAKGNTLLNAAGVDLDFIIDDNPLKQGLYTPGRNIIVFPSSRLDFYKDHKMAFIPLAWNFFDEIVEKIKTIRPDNEDDLFVRTFPVIRVE
jgi:SAM-dependent methyltransferase